jgi:hypothetical protein
VAEYVFASRDDLTQVVIYDFVTEIFQRFTFAQEILEKRWLRAFFQMVAPRA